MPRHAGRLSHQLVYPLQQQVGDRGMLPALIGVSGFTRGELSARARRARKAERCRKCVAAGHFVQAFADQRRSGLGPAGPQLDRRLTLPDRANPDRAANVRQKVVGPRERLGGGIELPPFSAQLPEIAKRDYGDQPWRAALEHLIEQLLGVGPAGNMQQTTGHFTAQEIAEPALDPQLSR